jgi:serine/threonine protein kinase
MPETVRCPDPARLQELLTGKLSPAAAGEHVDHRSDLFSLGSVMYAMCTGRPPFRASGTMAVLKRVIEDTPRPIQEVNPEIPPWLVEIIAKLHAKKPEERIQSAREVADILREKLAELQTPRRIKEGREERVVDGSHSPATRPTEGLPSAAGKGDLRSSSWPGQETGPQRGVDAALLAGASKTQPWLPWLRRRVVAAILFLLAAGAFVATARARRTWQSRCHLRRR